MQAPLQPSLSWPYCTLQAPNPQDTLPGLLKAMLHGGLSALSLHHGRRKRARVSFADDSSGPCNGQLLLTTAAANSGSATSPAPVSSPRDRDKQDISTSFGLVTLHGKYEMDILSFGSGAPWARQPDHSSFSVRVEPRQEAEGSCTSHAVVVQFVAEQAGPHSTSFGLSLPESENASSVQMIVRVSATVMGRHKGTPALRSSVHMVGHADTRSDSEDSMD